MPSLGPPCVLLVAILAIELVTLFKDNFKMLCVTLLCFEQLASCTLSSTIIDESHNSAASIQKGSTPLRQEDMTHHVHITEHV